MDDQKKQLVEENLDSVNGGKSYAEPEQIVYKYAMNAIVKMGCYSRDGISMMVKDATVCNRGYKYYASVYVPCYLLSCDGAIGWYLEDCFDEKRRQEDVDWREQ